VALLFGQEQSGLSNEELQRCHYHVCIPSNPEFSSLNLAMAVQVLVYELRMGQLLSLEKSGIATHIEPILSPEHNDWDALPATVNEFEQFISHLETTLTELDFLDPENPRLLMTRLRRLYQRCHLDKMEVNIMRGILASMQKSVQKKEVKQALPDAGK
jgi:tRNA (cytidine32/uridine32-2'-O)-methyltransferase